MIRIETITENLQEQLNAFRSEVSFNLISGAGDFKKAYRKPKTNNFFYPINGIVDIISSDILPIKGIEVATITAEVEFVLDVDLMEQGDNGEFLEVITIHNLLSDFISENQGVAVAMEQDGDVYEVVPSFDSIYLGTVSQVSPIGEALPLRIVIDYTFVENGVNTNALKTLLNGFELPINNGSVTRVRTSETTPLSESLSTKTVVLTNGISFNFILPLLDGELGDLIYDKTMQAEQNEALLLSVQKKDRQDNYIVIFGDTSLSFESGKNVGANINLIEGNTDIVQFNENWSVEEKDVTADEVVTITSNLEVGEIAKEVFICVFWGDGTSGFTESDEISHKYSVAGSYSIRIFKRIVLEEVVVEEAE